MTTKKPPASRTRLKNVTLFTESDEDTSQSKILLITQIKLPTQQPRRYFDPQKLAGLTESVQQHGILEPLLVRPLGSSTYELVAGERRYRAAQAAGITEIPTVVRELSDTEAVQIALIENLQREDLNPVEETEGVLKLLAVNLEKSESEVISLLHRMLDESKGKVPHNVMGNFEAEQVEQVFNSIALMEWQSFITNRLPLLKLPENVLQSLQQGKIAYTKAQAIARVKDEANRQKLLEQAIGNDLSLSQIREQITALKAERKDSTDSTPFLKQQMDDAYRQVKKSKVWDNPKKRKRLEKLLAELQTLAVEE